MCDRLAADGYADVVREKTGLVLDPYFAGTKVAWLLENVDGLRARAERGRAGVRHHRFLAALQADRRPRAHHGRHQCLPHAAARHRHGRLGRATAGGDGRPGRDAAGGPAELAGLRRDRSGRVLRRAVPVAGAIGDQQAALFAQGCFEQGTAKNTYGTGSFVLMNTGRDQITDQQVLLRTIAYGLEERPVEYALEGSILVTGSAVQWLRDELGIIENAAETEALAASLSSNDDVWFVPALTGLGAPHWDPAARGVLHRAHPGHHPGPRRPGRPGIDRLVDQGRDRRDGTRVGRPSRGASGRRRRDREPLAHAVPVGRAEPAARRAREHRDDRAGLGLSRRPRHWRLRRPAGARQAADVPRRATSPGWTSSRDTGCTSAGPRPSVTHVTGRARTNERYAVGS